MQPRRGSSGRTLTSRSSRGLMTAHDTVLPSAPNHIVGSATVCLPGDAIVRFLYAIPRTARPRAEILAFPGDGVPWPRWPSLPGACGEHPHAGGLLGTIHDRFEREEDFSRGNTLIVVEPRLAQEQPFAIFDSLLPFPLTASGEPTRRYDGSNGPFTAVRIDRILSAAYGAASVPEPTEKPALIALGFSKGCIVLNEILAEAATAERAEDDDSCLSRLHCVHYLDGGSQSRGAYLTEPSIAEALGRLRRRPAVCFHGTPRQWRDPTRAWLAEEKDRSVSLLKAAGVDARQREYFAEDAGVDLTADAGLAMHFGVVECFDLLLGRNEMEGEDVKENGPPDGRER